jgi:AraC-like DNA-binding protein
MLIVILFIVYFPNFIPHMKYIRHRIVVPESFSFKVHNLDLSLNSDIIHSHSNFELNFIIKGKGRRFVAGNISAYETGDLVLLGPDIPHGWEVDNPEDSPMSITIHFQEDLFRSGLFKIPEFESLQKLLDAARSGLCFKNIDYDTVRYLLEELKLQQGFDAMLKLLNVLRYLLYESDKQKITAIDCINNQNQVEIKRINLVYDYIFRNFNSEIRLKEVADLIHLSESAFSAYFKKHTKKSFFAFLKEIKIEYACKLLTEESDMNISQICYESGFNNVANFNRQFREITNMSPREYRHKYASISFDAVAS